MSKPVVPRPAATITLVRDAQPGCEVLMMQRSLKSGFMPGAYVFPGGGMDREDSAAELYALCEGLDDAAASARLGVEHGGLAYWVAAIRECFEEAGLLLCYGHDGAPVALDRPDVAEHYVERRAALNAGRLGFLEFCRDERLRLATDRLTYFSHWITPVGAPKRYDTRFFVAAAPERQVPLHDAAELVDHLWVRPEEALERDRQGQFSLRTPTKATLHQFTSVADSRMLIARLAAQKEIRAILPVVRPGGGRLLPGDPGYEEAARQPAPDWK